MNCINTLREKLVGKKNRWRGKYSSGKVMGALELDMQVKKGSDITAPIFWIFNLV